MRRRPDPFEDGAQIVYVELRAGGSDTERDHMYEEDGKAWPLTPSPVMPSTAPSL